MNNADPDVPKDDEEIQHETDSDVPSEYEETQDDLDAELARAIKKRELRQVQMETLALEREIATLNGHVVAVTDPPLPAAAAAVAPAAAAVAPAAVAAAPAVAAPAAAAPAAAAPDLAMLNMPYLTSLEMTAATM